MILSDEALEVLNYLKAVPGQFVAMSAISRRAGGRQRFDESPGWARGLMGPLVEAGLIEVNERGHYRLKGAELPVSTSTQTPRASKKPHRKVVGGDYFPAPVESGIVGDNYFPPGD